MMKPQPPQTTPYNLTLELQPELVHIIQSIDHGNEVDMLNIIQANALENLIQDINEIFKIHEVDFALQEIRDSIKEGDAPPPMTPYIGSLETLPMQMFSKIIAASYRCQSKKMTLHTGKDIRIENLVHYKITLTDIQEPDCIGETLSAIYPIHHLSNDKDVVKSFAFDIEYDYKDEPYMLILKFSCYKRQTPNTDLL